MRVERARLRGREQIQRVQVLKELKLFEGSVVTVPMNPEARVESVKVMLDELHARGETGELDKFRLLLRKMAAECEARIRESRKEEPFDWSFGDMVREAKLEADGANILRDVLREMR